MHMLKSLSCFHSSDSKCRPYHRKIAVTHPMRIQFDDSQLLLMRV